MTDPPITPAPEPPSADAADADADAADTIDHEQLAALADEFTARHRRGERPTVDEYARQ